MDLVVLSPHLDDGIFCCGGLIGRAAAAGQRVAVVTFCTQGPDLSDVSKNLRKYADYEQRKQEDARAVTSLGASYEWLGYVENVFRGPPVRHASSVFRTPPGPGVKGFTALNPMQESISDILERYPESTLLAPLGVGNHIDHVELFLAAIFVMLGREAVDRFRFYEDSYAMGTQMRKHHFVSKRIMWKGRDAPERSSIRMYLKAKNMAFARRGPPVETYLPESARDLHWTCNPQSIRGYEQAKIAAATMYESQINVLGGRKVMAKTMERYHRFWGGAEPNWHAALAP